MTLTIDDAPDIQACSGCMRPLLWLYSARTQQWVAFASVPGDTKTLKVDECGRRGEGVPDWREQDITRHDPDAAERAARGRALVDAAIRGEES